MIQLVSQEEHERKFRMKCGPPYLVMRRPCLMEDQGRHFFINKFDTLEEAEDWIASQEGEYFSPSDYYIAP